MQTKELLICVNQRLTGAKPSCAGRNSEALLNAFVVEAQRRGITLNLRRFMCFGMCERGPNIRISPAGRFFHRVTEADVNAIIDDYSAAVTQELLDQV